MCRDEVISRHHESFTLAIELIACQSAKKVLVLLSLKNEIRNLCLFLKAVLVVYIVLS